MLVLAGPSVDRLELVAGARRLAVEGGLGPRRVLQAKLEVQKLDLAKLPAGLLPEGQGIAGELTAEIQASGSLKEPEVSATLELEGVSYRAEKGDALRGQVRWNGAARRVAGRLSLSRGQAGTIEVAGELPLPLRGRTSEQLEVTLKAADMPSGAILDLLGEEGPGTGRIDATLELKGTVGTPALHGQLTVSHGNYGDLTGIGLQVTASVDSISEAVAEVRLSEKPVARLKAQAKLSAAALLADPVSALRGLRDGSLSADVTLLGLELADLSGHLGVPEGLRGLLTGEAHLSGKVDAPRGKVELSFAHGALGGYSDLSGRAEAEALGDRVELEAFLRLGDQGPAQLKALLRAPVERLTDQARLRAVEVTASLTVPPLDLSKAGQGAGVALGGVVEAQLQVGGTLARPDLTLQAAGKAVMIRSRLVGEMKLEARSAGERATAKFTLAAPTGGTLGASATMDVVVSPWLRAAELQSAHLEATARTEGLDLSFLPSVAPEWIRSASGALDADLSASGTLARLIPRGRIRLDGGRIASREYGEWTRIAVDGEVSEDGFELHHLEAHRGEGTLLARVSLRGLHGETGQLDGKIEARSVDVSRAGMDLATVTFTTTLKGTYQDHHLEVRLRSSLGADRVAGQASPTAAGAPLRPDITIGKTKPKKPAPKDLGERPRPVRYTVHLVLPGECALQRDNPRVRLELRADATYELEETPNP